MFTGVSLILDEEGLHLLNKCDKLFGGFSARHDSFQSLLQLSLNTG